MTAKETAALLDAVIALAVDAGHAIMHIYAQDFNVIKKIDLSPLTEADMAAHHIIVAGLEKLTPGIPVLSEESTAVPYTTRVTWHRYWLVDPLDGTREFVKRNGEFTVNIALIEDHKPILGVVYVPVTGVCYYARQGKGAYKQELGNTPAAPDIPYSATLVRRAGSPSAVGSGMDKNRHPCTAVAPGIVPHATLVHPCTAQKISVRAWDDEPLIVAGSQSHRSDSFDKFLASIGDCQVIRVGSSLKSCLVAEGTVHIYPRLGLTSEWDTAAAQCIVEEAGGHLTDTALRPLRYNTKESLLNPSFLVFGDARHDWSKYVPAKHVAPEPCVDTQASLDTERRK